MKDWPSFFCGAWIAVLTVLLLALVFTIGQGHGYGTGFDDGRDFEESICQHRSTP